MTPRSILVVAHPDDEALWFSGVLREVDRIIICFGRNRRHPERTDQRRRAIARHPLADKIFCLSLHVPTQRQVVDWSRPEVTGYGLRVPDAHESHVLTSFFGLCDALASRLWSATRIYTHNPWGEYGHEHHAMVHRAVCHLATMRANREVMFSDHGGPKSAALMATCHAEYGDPVATDVDLAHAIRDAYIAEGCWTADPNHQWPATERYGRTGATEAGR